MKRFRNIIIGFLLALILFTVTGFWVVPPVVKSLLIKNLNEILQRDVAVEKISFNPFSLCLTVEGFSIRERDEDGPFLSFRELFLNLEGMSVFKRAVIIEEFRLSEPHVHLARRQDGTYNFSDLLWKKDEASEEKVGEPLQFSVNNIRIDEGKIAFLDEPKSVSHLAEKIRIEIPFISNISYHVDTFVEPFFSAVVNGAPYTLQGTTKPFQSSRQTEFDIRISDLDVPHYLTYVPRKMNFRLISALLDAETKIIFRQDNEDQKQFLQLSGRLALKKIVAEDLQQKPLLNLSALEIDMASIEPFNREARFAKVTLREPSVHIRRNKQGAINLLGLLPEEGGEKETEPHQEKTALYLDAFLLEKGRIDYEDAGPSRPFRLLLEEIALQGEGLSTVSGKEGHASLSFLLPQNGKAVLEGPLTLSPLSAKVNIDVKDLDIPLFQPFIGDAVKVRIMRGKLSTQGTLGVTGEPDMRLRYEGKVSVNRFAGIDKVEGGDLLIWRSLHLNGVDVTPVPLSVRIGGVALTDFYSRIIIREDGMLNLQQLAATRREETAATREKVKESGPPAKPEAPRDIRIGVITLQGGRIDFLDRSIRPHFSAKMTEIGGRVSGLSSGENTKGDVLLRGKYEGYAPMEIAGKINPLKKDLYVDLKAIFKDMDLSSVTPYSGKYLGYVIEKGKLSFDLQYHIDRRKLDSSNAVFFDQLTLGERVESPDATNLPVSLAISLLKDRQGQIKLDIPVSGTLDDPEFSVWRIVFKVIRNLLARAATAPFALLGSLFGGGEELGYIEFNYGQADLDEESLKKIDLLTKALRERPALKMDLEGYVDEAEDAEALRREAFERKIKVQKQKDIERRKKGSLQLENVVITPDEYEQYLRKAYEAEKFPKPRNVIGLEKKLPVPEMEKLMYAHLEIKEDDLRLLAGRRSMAVREALLASGDIASERIFSVEAKYKAPPERNNLKKSRVDLKLK